MHIQGRKWCFTSYDLKNPPTFTDDMNYLLYGKEICPTTKRKHLQCFVITKKPVSLNVIKDMTKCPTAHFELCKGSDRQNEDYCKKDKKYKEFGEIPKQGKRSDLDELARLAPTTSCKKLVETFGGNALRHIRMIKEYQKCIYDPDWIEQFLQDRENFKNMSREDIEKILIERAER